MKISFSKRGWDDFLYWQQTDKKLFRRLTKLIRDTERSPFSGIGKPEPLRGNLAGFWSRRLDDSNRIVYRVSDEKLEIVQCRGHY